MPVCKNCRTDYLTSNETLFFFSELPNWPIEHSSFGPYNQRLCIDTTPILTTCGCDGPVICPANPCGGAICQSYPEALCRINFCAPVCEVFWVWQGQEINCPDVPSQGNDYCQLKDNFFNIGDVVPTDDPCQKCSCERGIFLEIKLWIFTTQRGVNISTWALKSDKISDVKISKC